jgi:hypothetical protein
MKNKEILPTFIGGIIGFLTYKILDFIVGKYILFFGHGDDFAIFHLCE